MIERLIDNFDLLGSAPNGVQQLRKMILQLAVQGKLVPQNPNDEPASILLARIKEEKELRIEEKDFNYTKIEDEPILEQNFILPKNWEKCQIGDVCELKTGATPSRSVKQYFGDNIKWLVSGDIHQQEIYDCEGRITVEGLNNSNCKLLPKNCVLIALNGQGKTRATVAILRTEATCNQSLVAMIPIMPKYLLPEYVFLNLRGKYYAIRDITGQKQRRGLNMKLVGSLSLEFPPFAEQKRIVAKVDQLMALCEDLEARQQARQEKRLIVNSACLHALTTAQAKTQPAAARRLFDHFDQLYTHPQTVADLRKAILQLAVQGKLVPQDPNDEPAALLLAKIKAEKERLIREKRFKKIATLLPIAQEEIKHCIPVQWKWERLGNVCYNITDGFHNTPKPTSSGYKYIMARHIRKDVIDFDSGLYVSPEDHNELVNKTQPERGDILVVNIGAGCGTPAIIKTDEEFSFKNIAILKRPKQVESQYLLFFLLSELSSIYEELTKGGAQPFLSLKVLRDILFPLPPLAEQKRIVAKVDQLLALCNDLESKLAQVHENAECLTASMVHHLCDQTSIMEVAS